MADITLSATGGPFNVGSSWTGGTQPSAADRALVVLASGNLTIDSGSVARSVDFSTYTGTVSGTANTLTIGDTTAGTGNVALKFVAGMTTSAFPISFISTSATVQTIDFAGKITGQVIFNAASNGSWQYTGAHTTGALVAGAVTLTKGTLDINGQTVSWNTFASSNSNVRSLILGAATVNITGTTGGTPWDMTTATNLTFSGASSTISFTGGAAAMQGGGKAYGTVTIGNSGTFGLNNSGGSFVNLSRTATAVKTDGLRLDNSFAVSGILTLAGDSSINRLSVFSNTVGAQQTATNTGATMTISNSDFMDVKFTTTWDASARTDIGDAGGNSGITFPASVSQSPAGTASFTWSTATWSGGRVPLPQDDANINNAFVAGRTITMDMPRSGRSIDFTGTTGTPAINFSVNTSIYGSLTLISGVTLSGGGVISFAGRSSYMITSAGNQLAAVTIAAPGGTYTLQDAFSSSSTLTISNGTFNASNFNVTLNTFSSSNSNTRALTMGSGTWTLTRATAGTIWDFGTTTNLAFSGASSTISISVSSASTRTFTGGSQIFGTLTYTVAGSTGQLNITGSNTFSTINFSDITNARTLAFTAGTTNNFARFNVNGTAGKLMSVQSITAATHTLHSSNLQSCDYLSLTNSIATGGPWYAGANSVDNGGNSGWIFTAPPASSGGSGGNGGTQSLKALQNLRNLV